MGLSSLLSNLLGIGSNSPMAPAMPQQWGYDPSGYLTPQANGGGAPVQQQVSMAGSPPPPQMSSGQPMTSQAPAPPPPDNSRVPATGAGAMVQALARAAPAAPSNQPAADPLAALPAPGANQGDGQSAGQPQTGMGGPTNPNAPITVTANPMPGAPVSGNPPDTWKPKHAGILGQISDYILGTHFGKNTERQNLEGSEQNMTSDPMSVVRRMAQFDPQAAQAMYGQVMREQHQTAMEGHQSDVLDNIKEQQVMRTVQGMAMNARPDNMPAVSSSIKQYMQAKGIDPSLIDTVPDANGTLDDFKTFAQGGIPAGRQAAITEHGREADQTNATRRAQQAQTDNWRWNGVLPVMQQNANSAAGNAKTNAGRLAQTTQNDLANQSMREQGLQQKPQHPQVLTGANGETGTTDTTGNFWDVVDPSTGISHRYIKGGVTMKNGKPVTNWLKTGQQNAANAPPK